MRQNMFGIKYHAKGSLPKLFQKFIVIVDATLFRLGVVLVLWRWLAKIFAFRNKVPDWIRATSSSSRPSWLKHDEHESKRFQQLVKVIHGHRSCL